MRSDGSVHGDADEPLVGHAGDRGRHDLAGEAQRLAHTHPSQIGDTYAAAVDAELVIGERETVVHALLAELRVFGPACKEILKRLPQLDDRHLRRVLGDFQHPRELLALDGVQLPPQGVLRGLGQSVVALPVLVLPLPFGQRPVVGKTRRARRPSQIRCLHVVRIERNLVGDQHCDASTACRTPSSSFWFLRERLPYSLAENTVMISSTSFAKSSSNVVSSPWLRITTSTPLASQIANTSSAPKRSSRS